MYMVLKLQIYKVYSLTTQLSAMVILPYRGGGGGGVGGGDVPVGNHPMLSLWKALVQTMPNCGWNVQFQRISLTTLRKFNGNYKGERDFKSKK